MTEFDKDLKYVKDRFSKIYTPDDLSDAKRLKRFFIDKYVLLISQTDKRFTQIQTELNTLELEATKRISSAYFFGK